MIKNGLEQKHNLKANNKLHKINQNTTNSYIFSVDVMKIQIG